LLHLVKDNLHKITEKKCSVCSQVFDCGMTESDGSCWCNQFPSIFEMNPESDCLCPVCLKRETVLKIKEYTQNLSSDEISANKVKDLSQTKKLIEDIDFYIEKDNYVFTAWYHLKRGYCCENGCRHCPYNFKK